MKKGDIVLIPFPFVDLSGNKNRPAIVLISTASDIIVCFITTQFKWQTENDIVIHPSNTNGLKKKSLIRLNKFMTIDKELVIGKLGEINSSYGKLLNQNLIKILQLTN